MDEKPIEATGPDVNRRRWLIATTVAGGVGGIAAAIPFVDSLTPPASALAAGAPVKVDISQLSEGAMSTVAWRGKPVFIVDRSPAMLASVVKATPLVADPDSLHAFSMPLPDYCKNRFARVPIIGIFSLWSAFARISVVRRPPGFSPDLSQTCPITGQVVSCAHVTDQRMIWRGVYSATSRHRRTSTFPATCSFHRPNCWLVRTNTVRHSLDKPAGNVAREICRAFTSRDERGS